MSGPSDLPTEAMISKVAEPLFATQPVKSASSMQIASAPASCGRWGRRISVDPSGLEWTQMDFEVVTKGSHES